MVAAMGKPFCAESQFQKRIVRAVTVKARSPVFRKAAPLQLRLGKQTTFGNRLL
jgi:hypothetical protein